jgi:DNA-binding FrmR family transcriptional regulator
MSHQSDRASRLTGHETRRTFPIMRGAHSVSWLLRALSLAAMGFFLSVGTAAAHGSHVADGAQVPAVAALNDEANLVDRSSAVTAVSPNQAHAAKTDGQPCSEDQGDGKHADILTQIRAVRAALDKVEQGVLRDHLQHCVTNAFHAGSRRDRQTKIDELMELLESRHS